jgi:hypothetical protein
MDERQREQRQRLFEDRFEEMVKADEATMRLEIAALQQARQEPETRCPKCQMELLGCDICEESERCESCDLAECGNWNCTRLVCRSHLTVCPRCKKTEMCQAGCLDSRFEDRLCCQACYGRSFWPVWA